VKTEKETKNASEYAKPSLYREFAPKKNDLAIDKKDQKIIENKLQGKIAAPDAAIDVQSEFDEQELIKENLKESEESRDKLLAVISYLWLFSLVPFLTEGLPSYVKYHARQGLLLSIIMTFWMFVWWLLVYYLSFGTWIVWGINVILILWMVSGIFNASSGKEKPLFLIGKIAENW